jgi:hypothetical protein
MFVASLQWLQMGSFCWKMWMSVSTFRKHLRIRQWIGALTANFPNTMHFLSIVNVCYVHTAMVGLHMFMFRLEIGYQRLPALRQIYLSPP